MWNRYYMCFVFQFMMWNSLYRVGSKKKKKKRRLKSRGKSTYRQGELATLRSICNYSCTLCSLCFFDRCVCADDTTRGRNAGTELTVNPHRFPGQIVHSIPGSTHPQISSSAESVPGFVLTDRIIFKICSRAAKRFKGRFRPVRARSTFLRYDNIIHHNIHARRRTRPGNTLLYVLR